MALLDWFRRTPRPRGNDSELADELAALRRDFKDIRLEWEATYEKMHTTLRKLAKRAERDSKAGCTDCGDPAAIEAAGVDWSNPVVRGRAFAAWKAKQRGS